ncbi:acetyl-CoA carboxylase biotin carboxyl carrier protein [Salinispora tropica]|uniref:Biotin carboxyl carrier protein of acetyl-CoA carboxylase n=1 Tax=Salinispora tropica (strain ATCC BAA-916 / DSM 44818 / JCM 13857 / NBRC 105044 / CNB-440) TaxID=369723 RepID=A4X7V0_SALTO|nr:acetyl-CoA carboxylase biotin carboxyl carrier protein [Salinispora tropica]ABP54950.1 acetyl-CoA carboxylase, biotin carboxyl carrier protein [Salinispora tropica CNB-440]
MSAELAPTGVPDLQGDAAADAASQSDGTFDDTPTEVSGASADAALAELRRQAQELLADLAGPVRRIRLGSGEAILEVEWHSAGDAEHVPPSPAASIRAPQPVVPPQPVAVPAARHAVRSPIVGTFYRAPEPGAAPFVAVGDRVHPGQVVGIVEAMKLMNEVTADRVGRIAEVLADDGQPVEYDQPLLAVDPV